MSGTYACHRSTAQRLIIASCCHTPCRACIQVYRRQEQSASGLQRSRASSWTGAGRSSRAAKNSCTFLPMQPSWPASAAWRATGGPQGSRAPVVAVRDAGGGRVRVLFRHVRAQPGRERAHLAQRLARHLRPVLLRPAPHLRRVRNTVSSPQVKLHQAAVCGHGGVQQRCSTCAWRSAAFTLGITRMLACPVTSQQHYVTNP